MDTGKDRFIFLQPEQKLVPPLFITDLVSLGEAFRMRLELLNAEKLGTERLFLNDPVPGQDNVEEGFKKQKTILNNFKRQYGSC